MDINLSTIVDSERNHIGKDSQGKYPMDSSLRTISTFDSQSRGRMLYCIAVLVIWAPTASFAETDDPAPAAKEFVQSHLSDPNLFLVNPPREMNPYADMTPQQVQHLRQNSQLHGSTLAFYPDGVPATYTSWMDGKLHGLSQKWYPSGRVMANEQYAQGKPMEGTYYDAIGTKLGEIRKGDGVQFAFRPTGSGDKWLVGTAEYKGGLKDGVEIGYRDYQTKQKGSEAYYTEGKLHGIKTTWTSSGQKNTEEHYRNGLKHGTSICWHENGNVQSVSEYADGRLVKPATMYHSNGQVQLTYDCDDAGRMVQAREYYANGQVKSITDYDKDTREKGKSQYYENGAKAERVDEQGHDIWFSSGQLMYSIKKEGRWGKILSGTSYDSLGNPNGIVRDGTGSVIQGSLIDSKTVTLTAYENGRLAKTTALPQFSVVLGYDKGGCRIDLKLDFKTSIRGKWEKGTFAILLPDKCTSENQLAYEIDQLGAGQSVEYPWISIKIPQAVEEWSGKILADVDGVVDGYQVRYQPVLYDSTLKKTSR